MSRTTKTLIRRLDLSFYVAKYLIRNHLDMFSLIILAPREAVATHEATLQQKLLIISLPVTPPPHLKPCISRYGCTLYNPTSRLATGHRSAQKASWGPRGGLSHGEWMKARRKERRGEAGRGRLKQTRAPASGEGQISCCLTSGVGRLRKHRQPVSVLRHVV